MLQATLKDHDFYSGELDGRLGAKTSAALKSFSQKYGTKSDPVSVFNFMIERAIRSSRLISDEALIASIKKAVSKRLLDSSDVQIVNLHYAKAPRHELVCGMLITASGAHRGVFGMEVTPSEFFLVGIDGRDDQISELTCALAFEP